MRNYYMQEQIKDFYSSLQFPGTYQIEDLQFYIEHGIHNTYLKEIERVIRPGMQILDVGCGAGLVSNLFAITNPCCQITAIDFSKSIEYAQKFSDDNNISNVNWVRQDFLEFESDIQYDVIICCGVLHHIPEHSKALAKIKQLLKPKGKLLLALYNPFGKVLKKLININYHSDILYKDQELNPFELSFTCNAVKEMCSEHNLTFNSVSPSINNMLVDFLALFNSSNGGLAMYTFTNE